MLIDCKMSYTVVKYQLKENRNIYERKIEVMLIYREITLYFEINVKKLLNNLKKFKNAILRLGDTMNEIIFKRHIGRKNRLGVELTVKKLILLVIDVIFLGVLLHFSSLKAESDLDSKYLIRICVFMAVFLLFDVFSYKIIPIVDRILSYILFLFGPTLVVYLIESSHVYSSDLRDIRIRVCVITILAVQVILLFLTKSIKISVTIASVVFFVGVTANDFVTLFRGTPILPWDIFSLRTAATVVGNYNIQFSISLLYRMMELLVFLKVLWSLKYKIKNIAVHIVLGALATAFSIVCLSKIYYTDYLNKNGFNEDLWNQNNSYSTNGFILGFGMNIKYMIVEKPENYSNANVKEIIKELVEAYDNENPTVEVNDIDITSSDGQANDNNVNMLNSDEKPTIIMIMNESLADLSVIGDFDTNEEYLPFINSMEENTIRGYLNVSVFGANTCNTEYEVLTSNTMAFLPSGSIAYQQYMNSTQNSICTTLKNNNYECIAMHPNPATNWNRDKAYALIGFDSFIADDGFSEVSNVRGLASDATTYDKVIELYLNRDKNKNLFIFDVTL